MEKKLTGVLNKLENHVDKRLTSYEPPSMKKEMIQLGLTFLGMFAFAGSIMYLITQI